MTSTGALKLNKIPKSMVVIGAVDSHPRFLTLPADNRPNTQHSVLLVAANPAVYAFDLHAVDARCDAAVDFEKGPADEVSCPSWLAIARVGIRGWEIVVVW